MSGAVGLRVAPGVFDRTKASRCRRAVLTAPVSSRDRHEKHIRQRGCLVSVPRNAINPFTPRACTDPFPFFDHATMSEVALREDLEDMRKRGVLPKKLRGELARLNRKARPAIYDPPPDQPTTPPSAA